MTNADHCDNVTETKHNTQNTAALTTNEHMRATGAAFTTHYRHCSISNIPRKHKQW